MDDHERLIVQFAAFVKDLDPQQGLVRRNLSALCQINTALNTVLAGGLNKTEEMRESALPGRLTAQERLVLTLAEQGFAGPAIADLLHVSVSTIHKHCSNACRKLGVSGRAAAVAEARRQKLIPAG